MSDQLLLEPRECYIAHSRAVARWTHLAELVGAEVVYRTQVRDDARPRAVLAWGRKPSAARAEAFARCHGLPVTWIEDGFLRSVGLGKHEPPLSLVVDDLGIYYDATAPSRLEALVARALSADEVARAAALVAAWRDGRVSKYNHAREFTGELPRRFVLAVDQTRGDASIRYGLANDDSFAHMLEAALDEHPQSTVLLKVHPDVIAGRKRGHFDRLTAGQTSRVVIVSTDAHPPSLLERAEAVYTVTSQMGFEGLLWGKPVHTFGMPFYGGWGLTHDALVAPPRRKPVPLENLVHAALVDYPRYVDPETGKRCVVERVLAHLALQRRMRERFPATVYAVKFSLWKKPIVRAFLQGSTVRFASYESRVPSHATVVAWGRRVETGGDRIQLEDGFLRSIGLGADLIRPLSWVMDRRGMYYDATAPSDLEHLLQTAEFDTALLERARRLRERIVEHGLTKYNVGAGRWRRPEGATRTILVPGQVESDASIRYGAPSIRTNIGVLRAVREANPDAYVVYKPHPDVLSGLRKSGVDENAANRFCDELVTDTDMAALLVAVDEVHVLTSLAGFEALLRGKKVVIYGQPFYAGWGLTRDMARVARRTRMRTLDELVAAVLIEYPTYVSRTTGRFTTPERALDELLAWRDAGASRLPWWRRPLRWVLRLRRN